MTPILLIDFGSTYTKVVAADISDNCPKLLGSASSPTTVSSDVSVGLHAALKKLEEKTGKLDYRKRLACSSAAGGLRMVSCGLTPELTLKAATLASLGAGAKLIGTYSYQLNAADINKISSDCPDILLLAGGTDGGNSKYILHNAQMLAEAHIKCPIVVAGNRSCADQIMNILKGKRAYLCENVMPALDTLNIEPVRTCIREIFIERIVKAKGLSGVRGLLDTVIMPTPSAVLSGVQLLSCGCDGEDGLGDLLAVDVGGATTDVYSLAGGLPRGASVVYKGLPEPYAKRTVEGDIGMRSSAGGIAKAAGIAATAKLAGLSEEKTSELIAFLETGVDTLPHTAELKALDFALASLAVETATVRHAGSLSEVFTSAGISYIQTGKDLTDVQNVLVTGGAVSYSGNWLGLAERALCSEKYPQSLRPKQARLLLDRAYILAAMGLLSTYANGAALRILKSHICLE